MQKKQQLHPRTPTPPQPQKMPTVAGFPHKKRRQDARIKLARENLKIRHCQIPHEHPKTPTENPHPQQKQIKQKSNLTGKHLILEQAQYANPHRKKHQAIPINAHEQRQRSKKDSNHPTPRIRSKN